MDEIEKKGPEGEALRKVVNETMNDENLSVSEKRRRRRDLILSSPLHKELTEEDEDRDAGVEEVTDISFRFIRRLNSLSLVSPQITLLRSLRPAVSKQFETINHRRWKIFSLRSQDRKIT